MADFKQAHQKLAFIEGGYVNHPSDRGGESYAGISRRWFPKWEGWERIESLKSSPAFPATLTKDRALQELVERFYEGEFWEGMGLGAIHSQAIAENLYLLGVNAGKKVAVKIAQRIIGVKADGILGRVSLEAINDCNEAAFVVAFDEAEMEHYERLSARDPSQKAFLSGWKNRVRLASFEGEGNDTFMA